MSSLKFERLQSRIRALLFEDAYSIYSDLDNLRAGQAVGEEEPLDSDPSSLPLDATPQAAVQLSGIAPPVDDPDFVPASRKELSAAIAALANELPDEKDVVEKVYDKVKTVVDDNVGKGVEVIDLGTVGDVEDSLDRGEEKEDEEDEDIKEARSHIKNQLIIGLIAEQSGVSDKDLYGNTYDDDDMQGMSEVPEEEIKAEPLKDEGTLQDVAKDMGISVSGAKRLEAEALKKMRLFAVHFPKDEQAIKDLAMQFYANGLAQLELIDPEDASALLASPKSFELKSFRQFMWDSFLNNVYKGMLRDAEKQGIPEEELSSLTPGLLDRAKDYFTRLPDAKKMKVLVASLSAAE
jgi:hypothetical protein